ncbi:hypothetical protein C8R47DRAFT_177857 [Mycena vitilis]|nr:hypothetical protein C8R47DRAFT_177857 [Mycena vitilis]
MVDPNVCFPQNMNLRATVTFAYFPSKMAWTLLGHRCLSGCLASFLHLFPAEHTTVMQRRPNQNQKQGSRSSDTASELDRRSRCLNEDTLIASVVPCSQTSLESAVCSNELASVRQLQGCGNRTCRMEVEKPTLKALTLLASTSHLSSSVKRCIISTALSLGRLSSYAPCVSIHFNHDTSRAKSARSASNSRKTPQSSGVA